jgi:CubicO group peptidase (beta-lactamase class C family)
MWSDDSAELFKRTSYRFQPGEELRYNQTNFLCLEWLSKKISSQSFKKYVTENQFEKAGWKNSIKAGMGDFSIKSFHKNRTLIISMVA